MRKTTLSLLVLLFLPAAAFSQASPSCIPNYVAGCVITVEWLDNSDNEDGFRIYRKLNAAGYTTLGATSTGAVKWIDVTVTQAAVSNTYCYQVTAFTKTAESAKSNEVCHTVAAQSPVPAAPSNAVLK